MTLTNVVWGKGHSGGFGDEPLEADWLPLWVHSYDTYRCALIIWDEIIPESVRTLVTRSFESDADARDVFSYLSLIHDVGKATPDFSGNPPTKRSTEDLYFRMRDEGGFDYAKVGGEGFLYRADSRPLRHETGSAWALEERLLSGLDTGVSSSDLSKVHSLVNSLTCTVAAHHGQPSQRSLSNSRHERLGFPALDDSWLEAQTELLDWADVLVPRAIPLLREFLDRDSGMRLTVQSQVMLAGLISYADWLASDENVMPRIPMEVVPDVKELSHPAFADRWDAESLHSRVFAVKTGIPVVDVKPFDFSQEDWRNVFARRTDGFTPNVLQSEFVDMCIQATKPDVYIVESEMGSGKTEAALMGAEVLLSKFNKQGILFALPTMATSEAIYKRVSRWLLSFADDTGSSFPLSLAHSKAQFSKLSQDNQFMSSGWFSGRYRRLLNPFVVSTIDNVLMLGLRVRYAQWRHMGFASKVVIVDEVHSADAYMKEFLYASLKWLAAYGCPVIILSATLSDDDRKNIVKAYQEGMKCR